MHVQLNQDLRQIGNKNRLTINIKSEIYAKYKNNTLNIQILLILKSTKKWFKYAIKIDKYMHYAYGLETSYNIQLLGYRICFTIKELHLLLLSKWILDYYVI